MPVRQLIRRSTNVGAKLLRATYSANKQVSTTDVIKRLCPHIERHCYQPASRNNTETVCVCYRHYSRKRRFIFYKRLL